MINIKPYEIGDEKFIDPVEAVGSGPAYDERWAELVTPETAWTSFDSQGRIIGMGGIIPQGDSAYVWSQLDKKAIERKPMFCRGLEELETMKAIVKFAESFNFPYIWTLIQDDFVQGHKMIIHLGFKKAEREGNRWRYERRPTWAIPQQQD